MAPDGCQRDNSGREPGNLAANEFVAFEGGRDGKGVTGAGGFGLVTFLDTDDFAHAAEADAGVGTVGGESDQILDRIALLQFAVRGEKDTARTQIPGFSRPGNAIAARPHEFDRQLQFKSLVSTLFAHDTIRLMLIT